MSRITVSVATVPTTLPTGVTAGALRISIMDSASNIVATQDVGGTSAVFPGIVDGTYTATAIRLDANGANLGEEVSAQFTAGTTTGNTFDAPSSLSVTVDAETA